MDQVTEDFITRSFTLQKMTFNPPFKPGLVQDIQGSGEVTQTVSSGLSTGGKIDIAAAVAVFVSLSLVVGDRYVCKNNRGISCHEVCNCCS